MNTPFQKTCHAPPGIPEAFDLGASRTRDNLADLAARPGSWGFDPTGDYANRDEGFFDIANWTSSFFSGMGALSFLHSADQEFITLMEALDPLYRDKIGTHAADTMHDLGFLYSLHSVALYKITGKTTHRDTGLRAAEVLANRFVPEGNYIRAWGRMDEQDTDYAGLAIIDSLMNMPLLYWAAGESGDHRFRDIAIRHTDTTRRQFIRPDGSVRHAFRFHPVTGLPVSSDNYCGKSASSQWARGTAWAMYGFALAHRHAGDRRYLETSLQLTELFVSSLGNDPVPLWDFRLDPGDPPLRDSSAAAIAACAIQELDAGGHASDTALQAKNAILSRLRSPDYLSAGPDCRGLIRNGQVSDSHGHARNVHTSWGDYFFMQALATEIGLQPSWW